MSNANQFMDAYGQEYKQSEYKSYIYEVVRKLASASTYGSVLGMILIDHPRIAPIAGGIFIGSVATGIVASTSKEYHDKCRERMVRQWTMERGVADSEVKSILRDLELFQE
jgi:uncharacterized protein (DUF697 family)